MEVEIKIVDEIPRVFCLAGEPDFQSPGTEHIVRKVASEDAVEFNIGTCPHDFHIETVAQGAREIGCFRFKAPPKILEADGNFFSTNHCKLLL